MERKHSLLCRELEGVKGELSSCNQEYGRLKTEEKVSTKWNVSAGSFGCFSLYPVVVCAVSQAEIAVER